MKPRALVACECSGAVRRALRARGWDAWSCDLKPAEDGDPHHIQGDVLKVLGDGWDLMIAHPVCTRLTNSGVHWLTGKRQPKGKTRLQLWRELVEGAEFYCALRDAPIHYRAVENPVMHEHAARIIRPGPRQVVQPWWFGDPFFKATGFELVNLPHLKPTNRLTPPKAGTPAHKGLERRASLPAWATAADGRSRTFPGVADAIADQWGGYVLDRLAQRMQEAA